MFPKIDGRNYQRDNRDGKRSNDDNCKATKKLFLYSKLATCNTKIL